MVQAWQQTYLGSQWNVSGSNISYSAGLVGIGTGSPTARFTLFQSSVSIVPSFTVTNINGGNSSTNTSGNHNVSAFIENTFTNDDGNTGLLLKTTNSTTLNRSIHAFAQQTANGRYAVTSVAFTSPNGSFGLLATAANLANPSNSYSIYGGSVFGGFAGYFDGSVTITGTFSNPSDEKLKKNLRKMNIDYSILGKVLKLEPINYSYDEKSLKLMSLPKNNQYGFTAQNIEKQFPELVSVNHHPGPENAETEEEKKGFDYKAVNYMQLIPILTQAIQEQQVMIEKLQKQVDLLMKK